MMECDRVSLSAGISTFYFSVDIVSTLQNDGAALLDPYVLSWGCSGRVGRFVEVSRKTGNDDPIKMAICEVSLRGHVYNFRE